MNIVSRVLWWGTCALAWIERAQCKHPNAKWEGHSLTLMGHREGVLVSSWHCLKCGKHFERIGGEKESKFEKAYFEGGEAYMLGGLIFDNPYGGAYQNQEGDQLFRAWRDGFMHEAKRRPRDPK